MYNGKGKLQCVRYRIKIVFFEADHIIDISIIIFISLCELMQLTLQLLQMHRWHKKHQTTGRGPLIELPSWPFVFLSSDSASESVFLTDIHRVNN